MRRKVRREADVSVHGFVACVTVTNTYTAMRHEVRETGKRPRDAYSEMIASMPKKFKSVVREDAIQCPHRQHFLLPLSTSTCMGAVLCCFRNVLKTLQSHAGLLISTDSVIINVYRICQFCQCISRNCHNCFFRICQFFRTLQLMFTELANFYGLYAPVLM